MGKKISSSPRAGYRGPGRPRTMQPKDATPKSPQHSKRLCPCDQAARRAAGEWTPVAAEGLDFGSTLAASMAQEATSPDAGGGGEPPAPLNRVLEYEFTPARTPAPAIQVSAGPPSTPPRPLDRWRERESGETPPSAEARPRKRRGVAVASPPAARHRLSFPAASVESSQWRGYSATVTIKWRIPGNISITGVQATTAVFQYYVRRFALSGDSDRLKTASR